MKSNEHVNHAPAHSQTDKHAPSMENIHIHTYTSEGINHNFLAIKTKPQRFAALLKLMMKRKRRALLPKHHGHNGDSTKDVARTPKTANREHCHKTKSFALNIIDDANYGEKCELNIQKL